jgi:tripartite-type tricarboxylate transporter receptor subunit TctC
MFGRFAALLRATALTAFAALLALSSLPAHAQTYPSRPVTILVPYTAGGATDILARILADGLSKRLGQPFVVEDRPGAGTVIAANAVAKAAPDGYTLLMGTSTPLAINATLHKHLSYDPVKDFVPLALVAKVPFVLIVNSDLPVRSVAGLIKYAKEHPGKLSYGTSGPGSPHHLYMELFKSMTGLEMVHVPYKGSVPALQDVMAGNIPVMFVDLAPSLNLIKAGKVRAIGVSSATKIPELPDVPPVGDTVAGFEAVAWQMLAAPAGTPAEAVDKLHSVLKQIEEQPEVARKVQNLGTIPVVTPAVSELKDYVKSEVARWGEIVKKAGASIE